MKVDKLLQELREALVGRDLLPPALARLSETIRESHNISSEDNALRLI